MQSSSTGPLEEKTEENGNTQVPSLDPETLKQLMVNTSVLSLTDLTELNRVTSGNSMGSSLDLNSSNFNTSLLKLAGQ